MTENAAVSVAFVGAGYMTREHMRAFHDIPGVRIAGLHSRTRARAVTLSAEFGGVPVYDSVAELYDRTSADLVVVSVPELAANQVMRACFEHPWTALVEKPAGYNVPDAQEILDMCVARNRRAYVALNRRFYASTRAARADLAAVPERRFIHVMDQQDQRRALEAGQPPEVVANWMYANSIHVVDYFQVFGRGSVVAVEPIVRWTPDAPWMVIAQIVFDSGDIGEYHGIWDGPGPWAVTVSTPRKRWEMRPLEQATVQLAGERRLQVLEPDPKDTAFKPGLRLQAEHAVAAARGAAHELPTLADALISMRIVEGIFRP